MTRTVLALSLALAVACGGDDGGDEAMTKEEVIAEGDRICRETDAALDEVEGLDTDPFAQGADTDAFLQGLDEGIEIAERRVEGVRDLDPPEEDRETFDRFVAVQEEILDRVRELRDAVEEGDEERAQELFEANSASAQEAEQLASEYGFEECGSLS